MGARSILTLRPTAHGRGARAKALMRPMGAVAVRIPHRVSTELGHVFPSSSPRLFVHEGARQALERRLARALPWPVSLSVSDNRHGVITHEWDRGVLIVRAHHMFLDAPPSIVSALVSYIAVNDRDASSRLGHFIEANSGRLAPRSRTTPLVTAGFHHDILSIFNDLNDRYFGGSVTALITWGRETKKRTEKRKAIRLGSYSASERLIRIHPCLDRNWVPRYFVTAVVYHEMLHHVFPHRAGSERRALHPAEFREREREYRFFERALRWEKAHLSRLLRA